MVRTTLFMCCLALGACSFPSEPTNITIPTVPPDTTAADTMQIAQLRQQLDSLRSEVLDKRAMELEAVGNALYWKTYPGFSPLLHHREASGQMIEYAFSIGAGDDNNYRASQDLVVTATRDSAIVYHAYDAHASNKALGTWTFPTPSDEQKWWAFAVSGTTAFVIAPPRDAAVAGHAVWSCAPGADQRVLFTLEETGIKVGELMEFGVDGTTLMVIESGRLWHVDMALKRAKFMGNKTEISGSVDFTADGVIWQDMTGLKYFDSAAGALRDLSKELHAAAYKINETYKTSHYFYGATTGSNFARWKDWLVYTANSGIFAYNLKTMAVRPVLLDTNDDELHIAYRYPVPLENGSLFVVGLTSTSGSTGADGPVYQTDLTKVLAL